MNVIADCQAKGISLCASLRLSDCRVRKPHLLTRAGFDVYHPNDVAVLLLAVPYLTPQADLPTRNVSSYAVSRDYHLFFKQLYDELIPPILAEYPNTHTVGFADHSPIDEVHAAAVAGLGVVGRNHLLLTEAYSSYVFLGALFTDAPVLTPQSPLPYEAQACCACGRCERECPSGCLTDDMSRCLSSLTQKRGELTDGACLQLRQHPLVWGCDTCQQVCPYTARAKANGTIYTDIPFFYEQPIPTLTLSVLDGMSDEQFSERAYAWRGRTVIRRNLLLHATNTKTINEKEEGPCSI